MSYKAVSMTEAASSVTRKKHISQRLVSMISLIGAVILGLAVVFHQAKGSRDKPSLPLASFPFRSDAQGRFLVTVSINGAGPFELLLDSGATCCTITPAAAKKAKLFTTNTVTTRGLLNRYISVKEGQITQLSLPGLTLFDQVCDVIPSPPMSDYDGILAGNIFQNYIVEVNSSFKTIRVYDPSNYKVPLGTIAIPIVFDFNTPVCSGTINKQNCRLKIDTGFDGPLKVVSSAKKLIAAITKTKACGSYQSFGIDGISIGKAYYVHQINLHGATGECNVSGDVIALVPTHDQVANQHYSFDAILGGSVLSHSTITFDYPHKRLLMQT